MYDIEVMVPNGNKQVQLAVRVAEADTSARRASSSRETNSFPLDWASG